MTLIYCENCDRHQPLIIDEMKDDNLNPNPWGDLVCGKCHLIIATLTVDEPGIYEFKKIEEKK